jgi:hypothetical protein
MNILVIFNLDVQFQAIYSSFSLFDECYS